MNEWNLLTWLVDCYKESFNLSNKWLKPTQ